MVRVNGCCCFSLKTGTLIIATLGWVGTLLKTFGFLAILATQADEIATEDDFDITEYNAETLPYRIAYAVVSFVVSVLLVVGIYKKTSWFFIPYLVISCLECIGLTIFTVFGFISIFFDSEPVAVGFGVLFAAAFTALSWYLWIVVYSYYQKVREETAGFPTARNVYYSPTSASPPP